MYVFVIYKFFLVYKAWMHSFKKQFREICIHNECIQEENVISNIAKTNASGRQRRYSASRSRRRQIYYQLGSIQACELDELHMSIHYVYAV